MENAIKHHLLFRTSNILMFFMLFLILFFISGCNSGGASTQTDKKEAEEIDNLRNQMFNKDNPENHIAAVRDYVFSSYPDLPDDIISLISNTKPRILYNENEMVYAFFWTLPDGVILEVVTTPPPLCEPISTHKEKRVTYP